MSTSSTTSVSSTSITPNSSSSIQMLNEESSSQSSVNQLDNSNTTTSSNSSSTNSSSATNIDLNSIIESSVQTAATATTSTANLLLPNLNFNVFNPNSYDLLDHTIATGTASSTLNDEPEHKKVKLTHYSIKSDIKHQNMLSNFYNQNNNYYLGHKKLEERIGGILCCTVCLDLPQTAIYQCTNGHLMCAGCFSHLLADARLKDEQATCPNCRCEISKTSCCRNLAVEKTLSELPASCIYCNMMTPRNLLDLHQKNECLERPTKCVYKRIGCTWEGPYHEIEIHGEQCSHPNKPAKEIMPFLNEKDSQVEEERQSLLQLVNFLSLEKVCFNDLQFKQYKTDEITPKLYFETNRFNAFFHQWVLKARVNDNQKHPNLSLNRFISYQLILKSKLSSSSSTLDVKFCVLKGPFGEVTINPSIQSFEFNQTKIETDYIKLNINSADCNKLLGSKTINFRFFMFQS